MTHKQCKPSSPFNILQMWGDFCSCRTNLLLPASDEFFFFLPLRLRHLSCLGITLICHERRFRNCCNPAAGKKSFQKTHKHGSPLLSAGRFRDDRHNREVTAGVRAARISTIKKKKKVFKRETTRMKGKLKNVRPACKDHRDLTASARETQQKAQIKIIKKKLNILFLSFLRAAAYRLGGGFHSQSK